MTMSIRREDVVREPPLSELLADPIIRAAMASDGATEEEVKSLVRRIRESLLARQHESRRERFRNVAVKDA